MIIKSHMIPELDILGSIGKFVIRGTTSLLDKECLLRRFRTHQLFRPVT